MGILVKLANNSECENKRQIKEVHGSERFNETYFISVSATKE